MRRDLLQCAGRGQCSFLQPGVDRFNMSEPLLKFADPQPEGADFLRDGLEVFQVQEMIRCGLAHRQVSHRARPDNALRKNAAWKLRSAPSARPADTWVGEPGERSTSAAGTRFPD